MASGVTVAYNGNVIHQMPSNGSFKMNTANVYMEGDVDVVVDVDSGGSTLVQKSITANGTYNASEDNADGYSQVVANVPNSYAQADEGKVVSNGALVAQTSATKTENGTYDTTLNNQIVVNVQGGSSTLISKTITENGTYHAEDDDADGYSNVNVDVAIANWDFTQSLIDSVNGLEATLTSGASRDSNGVTISGASGRIVLPKGVQGFMRTFEIEVGDITSATGSVFLITSGGDGIGYKDGSWRLYSGSWDTATNVTDLDAFANGVIKIYIDENGYWHIYKDDVLLWDSNKTLVPANQTATIGYSSNSLRTMVIKSVKVY